MTIYVKNANKSVNIAKTFFVKSINTIVNFAGQYFASTALKKQIQFAIVVIFVKIVF